VTGWQNTISGGKIAPTRALSQQQKKAEECEDQLEQEGMGDMNERSFSSFPVSATEVVVAYQPGKNDAHDLSIGRGHPNTNVVETTWRGATWHEMTAKNKNFRWERS
jgi:hypothetical protein